MRWFVCTLLLLLTACASERTPAARVATPTPTPAPEAAAPEAVSAESTAEQPPARKEPSARDGFSAEKKGSYTPSIYSRELSLLYIEQTFRHEARFLSENLKKDRGLAYQGYFLDAQQGWTQPTSRWSDEVKARVKPLWGPLRPRGREEDLSKAEFLAAGYDVIIVGDITMESELWRQEYWSWLDEWVKAGGGLVLLAGKAHHPAAYKDITAYRSVCPLVLNVPDDVELVVDARAQKYLGLSDAGHPLFQLTEEADRNRELFGSESDGKYQPGELHGIYWYIPAGEPKPGAQVLARVALEDSAIADGAPLIVSNEHGKGRVLWLGTDDFHYWRQWVGEYYFYRFWQNAIRWVARDPGK